MCQDTNQKSNVKRGTDNSMKKKSRLVAGIMSGTSLDGVDAVLLRVSGSGKSTRFQHVAAVHQPFPPGLRNLLLRNSSSKMSRVDDIARLNVLLAVFYADAMKKLGATAHVRLSDISLIGSHGQTVHHLPNPVQLFGKSVRATLQIGDPSVLATLTGIPTVGDFRVADVAAGGQGAPLVPYFDWLVYRSKTKNRLLLNIGGIANFTVLPKNCSQDDVRAFDTGPGNMIVDGLMREYYGHPFDRNGKLASTGILSLDLFRWLMKHPYLRKAPPKSTGREEFGEKFLNRLLKRAKQYDREDIITTVTQFTAYAVYVAYRDFVEPAMHADELIVSGGGSRNKHMMEALRHYFMATKVLTIDDLGMPSESKEAACFAILANECVAGNPANLPGVTGAMKRVILGKLCTPTTD